MAKKKKEVVEQPKPKTFVIYHLQQALDLSWCKRKVKEFQDYKEAMAELKQLNHDELPTDFYVFQIEE